MATVAVMSIIWADEVVDADVEVEDAVVGIVVTGVSASVGSTYPRVSSMLVLGVLVRSDEVADDGDEASVVAAIVVAVVVVTVTLPIVVLMVVTSDVRIVVVEVTVLMIGVVVSVAVTVVAATSVVAPALVVACRRSAGIMPVDSHVFKLSTDAWPTAPHDLSSLMIAYCNQPSFQSAQMRENTHPVAFFRAVLYALQVSASANVKNT